MQVLIPLTQAAAQAGCSREHLMRAARRGELPGAKVGREWSFTPEALRDFHAARTPVRVELEPVKPGRRRNAIPRI